MTPLAWIAVGVIGTLAIEAAGLWIALRILARRDRAADERMKDGDE